MAKPEAIREFVIHLGPEPTELDRLDGYIDELRKEARDAEERKIACQDMAHDLAALRAVLSKHGSPRANRCARRLVEMARESGLL